VKVNNYCFEVVSSDELDFFACCESVGNTFNIKDKSYTSKNPFLWWKFGLELGGENVGVTSVFCLVAWALIDSSINLDGGWKWHGSAVHDWHDRELLLWSRLFKLSDGGIPSGSFDLETEDISTLFAWWKICLPIEFLKNVSLDGKLVELLFFLSGVDLLNGSQE